MSPCVASLGPSSGLGAMSAAMADTHRSSWYVERSASSRDSPRETAWAMSAPYGNVSW